MQTAFTEDQETFRSVVARFLEDNAGAPAIRALIDSETGYDAAVWKQLCEEVGLAGTHIPEAYGGFGFGAAELGIAAEEMGRQLYSGPFFASSVMAGYALLYGADEDAKAALLPGIAAGSTVGALVLDDLNAPEHVGSRLEGANGSLTGSAPLVVDGQHADLLVVVAGESESVTDLAGEKRLGLYQLAASTPGVSVTPVEAVDPSRKLARVDFVSASATRIGDVSAEALRATWNAISIALAHEMVGGAQRLLDTTVEYTKLRYQFGRPIGSFQGLKHRCAELLMDLEFAKAATHHAAFCFDANEGEPYAANMAKAMAADTYMRAAREAIQMRGGIGFTWEEDTHFWFKRAKSSEVLLGTPAMHRERMVTLMEQSA